MNSHRVDRILDAIDAGPQRTTEASYGETKEPGWCWRCLLAPVDHAEQMCDDCRRWMGGETDDDPRTRARKYNFADLFASVDPDPTLAGSADSLSQINANVEAWDRHLRTRTPDG